MDKNIFDENGDLIRINLVECVCERPTMFTANGTLADIYEFLLLPGYQFNNSPNDKSVNLTLDWLHENALDRQNVVNELIEKHGSDEAAIKVIADFASSLPSA